MKNKEQKNKVALISLHGDPLEKIGSIQAGGQNVYVNAVARNLVKLGWKVDVFTRWDSEEKKRVVRIDKNFRVIRLLGGEKKFLEKDLIFDSIPSLVKDFFNFIEDDYDIVHGNYWLSGKFCLDVRKKMKSVKYVETFHSLGKVRQKTLEVFREQKRDEEIFKRRVKVEEEVVNKFDKIIATSPFEKKDLERLYGLKKGRAEIVPCGVDTKVFTPKDIEGVREKLGISKDKKIILYVGRLEWRKGLGTLFYAMHCLLKKKELDDIVLLIVGGDKKSIDEKKRLDMIANDFGISDKIVFLGRKSHEELSVLYSAAYVSVIPSYYEPFGLIALESMACGTPVIASKVGGLQYTVLEGKTGLLAKIRDYNDLCDKLEIILMDDDLRNRMGKEGIVWARKFDWKEVVKRISDLYEKIMNNE